MAGTPPPPNPAIVVDDRACIRLSGKNAMLATAASVAASAIELDAVIMSSPSPDAIEDDDDDDDDDEMMEVLYSGKVSINALNTNGVAIVTPFPASMREIDATTLCLMALACCRSEW